jgi:hypothetical protein
LLVGLSLTGLFAIWLLIFVVPVVRGWCRPKMMAFRRDGYGNIEG